MKSYKVSFLKNNIKKTREYTKGKQGQVLKLVIHKEKILLPMLLITSSRNGRFFHYFNFESQYRVFFKNFNVKNIIFLCHITLLQLSHANIIPAEALIFFIIVTTLFIYGRGDNFFFIPFVIFSNYRSICTSYYIEVTIY